MSIAADDEIDITSTLIDINGNVDISGTTLVTGVLTSTAIQVVNGGLALATNKKIQFRDSAVYINSDADGHLEAVADTGITFKIGSTEQVLIADGKVEPTTTNDIDLGSAAKKFKNLFLEGDITASGHVHVLGDITSSANVIGVTGSFGHITGSFAGDGTLLTGVTADAVDIDALTAFSGVPHATQDEFLISDNGTELRATMTMVANGAFALVSGDIGIAAGGAATLGTVGANHITEISNLTAVEGAQLENINSVTISNTQWGYVGALDQAVQTNSDVQFADVQIDGNLVVAGTASFTSTDNLNIKDRFISLASGSTAVGDGGIVVNHYGGNDPSGSAFGYEGGTANRWAVQNEFSPTGSTFAPDAYMGIVTFSTSVPSGNPTYGGANYGYGNIHVETDTGDVFIFA